MAEIRLNGYPRDVTVAAHAIGLGNKKPYCRHGKLFYRPYRNYFAAGLSGDDHDTWVGMEADGYAKSRHAPAGHKYFWLTRKGLDWLGEILGMTIYDEDD